MSFLVPIVAVIAWRTLARRAQAAESAVAKAKADAAHEHDRGKHAAELARDEHKKLEKARLELSAAERAAERAAARAADAAKRGKHHRKSKPDAAPADYDPEKGDTTDNMPPAAAPFDAIDEMLGTSKAKASGDVKVRAAAVQLRAFLAGHRTRAAYGYKGAPSAPVQAFQRAAKLTPDGIMGPKTFGAGKALGIAFPPRPTDAELSAPHDAAAAAAAAKARQAAADKAKADKAAADAKAKADAARRAKAAHDDAATAAAAKARKAAADKAKADKAAADAKAKADAARRAKAAKAPPARSAAAAAADLLAYAKAAPTGAARASYFGYRDHVSPFVLAAQRDMGIVNPDGIYGPATRARGLQLTGKTFPTR